MAAEIPWPLCQIFR